jgi:hypothetical protein
MDEVQPLGTEEIVAALENQICPWCGKGPYTFLGMHIYRKHGLTVMQLKEMADLPIGTPTCDPKYSEKRAEMAKECDAVLACQYVNTVTLSPYGRKRRAIHNRRISKERLARETPEETRTRMMAVNAQRDPEKYRKARRRGEEKACPVCGDTFYRQPSHHQVYCSSRCYHESRRKAR